jgi:hypothetical protein
MKLSILLVILPDELAKPLPVTRDGICSHRDKYRSPPLSFGGEYLVGNVKCCPSSSTAVFHYVPCIFVGDVASDKISLSCEAHLGLWV